MVRRTGKGASIPGRGPSTISKPVSASCRVRYRLGTYMPSSRASSTSIASRLRPPSRRSSAQRRTAAGSARLDDLVPLLPNVAHGFLDQPQDLAVHGLLLDEGAAVGEGIGRWARKAGWYPARGRGSTRA